jgi:hypothetical protein
MQLPQPKKQGWQVLTTIKVTSSQLNPSDFVGTNDPSTGFLHNLMKY